MSRLVCLALLLACCGWLGAQNDPEVNAAMARDDVAVWPQSSMVRVLPGEPAPAAAPRTIELSLARGEYESAQVLIRTGPGTSLQDVRVELSELLHANGTASIGEADLEWYQVGFVRIEKPDKTPSIPARWLDTGWYPDPLLPVESFSVAEGFTQPIWVTVHAPRQAEAGDYTGTVTVKAKGGTLARVPLSVHVYDFELAPGAGHLRTAFSLGERPILRLYEGDRQMLYRWQDYMLDRLRLNPFDLWLQTPPPLDRLKALNARGMNAFPLAYLPNDKEATEWPFAPSPEKTRALLEDLRPTVDELRRLGLLKKAYLFGGDEVPAKRVEATKASFALVQETYPDVTLMTTAHVPQTEDDLRGFHLDALCPMWDWGEFERLEGLRKAGFEMWAYISLQPYAPFPNWRMDNDLMQARTIFWQVYHQKFDAFLYWALILADRPGNDKLIDPADGPFLSWSISTSEPDGWIPWLHGDGRMLYAGTDGPIGSIRLDNIRDGLEDYEYLWLLSDATGDAEAGREACIPVASGLDKFTGDPQVLRRERDHIAQQIEGAG